MENNKNFKKLKLKIENLKNLKLILKLNNGKKEFQKSTFWKLKILKLKNLKIINGKLIKIENKI